MPPCPDHPPVPPSLPTPLPGNLSAALASLNASFAASLDALVRPGGMISVSIGGVSVLSSFLGVADKASGRPVDESTLFRIASVSKCIPAALLYLLHDAGLVDLDDEVSQFAPLSPRNPFDSGSGNGITFRQLASQLSGLQREAPYGASTTASVLAAVNSGFLILPPGRAPSYSNLGFSALGHILAEFVTNPPTTMMQLFEELVGAPLNLDMGFNYSADGVFARLASGYDAQGNAVPFYDAGWSYPAGGAYSSVGSMDAFASALLAASNDAASPSRSAARASTTPLQLSPSTARELLSPVFWNRDGLSLFGTPWEIVPSSNFLVLSKGGNLPGYTATLALVPDLDLVLSAAWNGGGLDEIAFTAAAMDALLPVVSATFAALAPAPPYTPPPAPEDYVGIYSLTGGGVIDVRFLGGILLWAPSAFGWQVGLDWVVNGDPNLGDVFRVDFPDAAYPCLTGELLALKFQYVTFARNATNGVFATALQGWAPGAVWTR